MTIELFIPDSLKLDEQTTVEFKAFLQAVVNRRCVGVLRYGDKSVRKKKYMTRLLKEVQHYKANGNFEQLLNVAVYCFLESSAPENKKFHFDATVDSVTREREGK